MLCMPVFASEKNISTVSSANAGYSFSTNVNTDSFVEYLVENLVTCPKRLDVSSFNIPYTTQDAIALQKTVWYNSPLLFHVNGIGYTVSDGIIDYVYFTYHYDSEEYVAMYEKCVAAAEKMIGDLKGNKAVNDVTKALLVHDRLIVNCEYDYKGVTTNTLTDESQSMYGALVNGVATCQGYSQAYMYLLGELGIDSYVCSSEDMDHDWNIVIINGKKYHVDVTFDDPVQDVTGRVYHNYFLLSTAALKKGDHNFTDYDSSPKDTAYDNYYWKNSAAEFQLIDNKVYYLDNERETLNCVGSDLPLTKVSDVWTTPEGNYWKGNYARLSSDGVDLLYSLSDTVYLYDLSAMKAKSIYKPTLSGDSKEIYGFTYDNGYLVLDLFNKPNFNTDTKANHQIKVPYDLAAPTASLSCTNESAAYQTVTLSFTDNIGISGYYWGTDPSYLKNTFTYFKGKSAKQYVSEAGTYYLTARDNSGNLSETVSLTFYVTHFDANGGTVSTPTVITPKGKNFVSPLPVREGYIFTGWSLSAADGGTTYYATWKADENYISADKNDYTNRFTDVADNAWYADAVTYCAGKGYISGVGDGLFSPNTNLTREQFVTILACVAGVSTDSYKYADSGMKDVPVGKWYSGAVAWGVSEGYVEGVSADRFGLKQNITREQLARLFYVYGENNGADMQERADLKHFSDSGKVSGWAKESMQWAVAKGLISGITGSTLAPKGNATRAQAARMFMVFEELI